MLQNLLANHHVERFRGNVFHSQVQINVVVIPIFVFVNKCFPIRINIDGVVSDIFRTGMDFGITSQNATKRPDIQ